MKKGLIIVVIVVVIAVVLILVSKSDKPEAAPGAGAGAVTETRVDVPPEAEEAMRAEEAARKAAADKTEQEMERGTPPAE